MKIDDEPEPLIGECYAHHPDRDVFDGCGRELTLEPVAWRKGLHDNEWISLEDDEPELATDGGKPRWMFGDDSPDFDTETTVERHRAVAVIDSVDPGTETISHTITRAQLLRAIKFRSGRDLHFVTDGETLAICPNHPEEEEEDRLPDLGEYIHSPAVTRAIDPDPDHTAAVVDRYLLLLDYQTIPGDSDEITVHVEPDRPVVFESADSGALVICPRYPPDGNPYEVDYGGEHLQ
ncbi:hypothetical protein [Halobaculum sp. P14]|uniref:hypothetical protein n=1 Tax=Halobaculum sp. P14 TaxID=3421638 RepID=UPI003EBF0968